MECKCNGGQDHHEHNEGCGCNDHHPCKWAIKSDNYGIIK